MSYQGMEDDIRLTLAAGEELAQYLSSSIILWRVKHCNQPLSPGNLLLAITRLKTVNEIAVQHDEMNKVEKLIDTRRQAWENRARQEIPLRLNQYRELVDEYLEQGAIDASYRSNISTRVKLDLLFRSLAAEPYVEQRKAQELDRQLGALLPEGDFIWEPELETGFPKSIYAYLYVRKK